MIWDNLTVSRPPIDVMAGLDPAIQTYVLRLAWLYWMAGSSPAMTTKVVIGARS